jgi:hypothetical protein
MLKAIRKKGKRGRYSNALVKHIMSVRTSSQRKQLSHPGWLYLNLTSKETKTNFKDDRTLLQ